MLQFISQLQQSNKVSEKKFIKMRVIVDKIKKYIFELIIYIVLYSFLSLLLFSFINYTHQLNYYRFYLFSFLLNIFFLIPKDKNGRYLFFTLIINFYVGTFYFISGSWAILSNFTFVECIRYLLFSLFRTIISWHWSLPILFILIDKILKTINK